MEAKQLAAHQLQTEDLKFPEHTMFLTLLKTTVQLYYFTVDCIVCFIHQKISSTLTPKRRRVWGFQMQEVLRHCKSGKSLGTEERTCETSEQNHYGSQIFKADIN